MSDLKIIEQLIKVAARTSLQTNYDKTYVELVEEGITEPVTILGLPPDSVVIKIDSFWKPDCIFSGTKGECKRADYVIIADKNGKKRVIYIEMKKTTDSFTVIKKQLYGAKCFMHYCQEIGRCFWDKKDFLKDFQHRFVIMARISIAKKKTIIERSSSRHDTPENAMKIYWPSKIQFNQLLGEQ